MQHGLDVVGLQFDPLCGHLGDIPKGHARILGCIQRGHINVPLIDEIVSELAVEVLVRIRREGKGGAAAGAARQGPSGRLARLNQFIE